MKKLVVATVNKHNASSVGVTLEERANLLTSLETQWIWVSLIREQC